MSNIGYVKVYFYFTGMIHSGTGHTQITNFMSTLEIKGLHHTTMKLRELEVESHVFDVAQQSCHDAIHAEIECQNIVRYKNCPIY